MACCAIKRQQLARYAMRVCDACYRVHVAAATAAAALLLCALLCYVTSCLSNDGCRDAGDALVAALPAAAGGR